MEFSARVLDLEWEKATKTSHLVFRLRTFNDEKNIQAIYEIYINERFILKQLFKWPASQDFHETVCPLSPSYQIFDIVNSSKTLITSQH